MTKKQMLKQKKQMVKQAKVLERTAKKEWKHLSQSQQTAVVAGAVISLTLLAAAQIDLARRSADEVRGRKWMWRILTLVNFIGPIAYFLIGRKKSATTMAEVGHLKNEAAA